MPLALPAAGFLLGLASGVHCLGMCGGIVAAFSSGSAQGPRKTPAWPLLAAFNAGRVGAYTFAGAAAGAFGGAGAYAAGLLDMQVALFVAANVALVLIGLHLAGVSPALARLEALGRPVWKRIQPLAARVLPARTLAQAVLAGSLWGWLPCGLVYGMLVTAVASGSAERGALTMLAFGLGTVPNMMLAGMALERLRRLVALRSARLFAGSLVLAFGVFGLARSADLGEAIRRGLLCL